MLSAQRGANSPILRRLKLVVGRTQLETNLSKPNLDSSWSSQVILQTLISVLLLV